MAEQKIQEENQRKLDEARKQAVELAKLKSEEEAKRVIEQQKLEQERMDKEAEEIKIAEEKRLREKEEVERIEKERIQKEDDERKMKIISERLLNDKKHLEAKEEVVKEIPQEEIAKMYSNERTDETTTLKRLTITRTVFNRNKVITFYTKVVHVYGGVYFFKDAMDISEWQYNNDTK